MTEPTESKPRLPTWAMVLVSGIVSWSLYTVLTAPESIIPL